MSGIRIHELAKELGVANKVLIDLLATMGYAVKSHASTIEHSLGDRLRRQVKQQVQRVGVATKKKPAAKKTAVKPAAKKTAVKPAAKKTAVKPAAKKTAVKPAAKKTTAKPAAKKTAAKPTAKKTTAKPAVKSKTKTNTLQEKVAIETSTKGGKTSHKIREEASTRKDEASSKEFESKKNLIDKKKQEKIRELEEIAVRKRFETKRRKAQDERKRKEAVALKKAEAEKRRKIEEDKRRKAEEEEREIQRLIDEEERVKLELAAKNIVLDAATTVKEFAAILRMSSNELILQLMKKGIMATLNQTIGVEVARTVALELGYKLKKPDEEKNKPERFQVDHENFEEDDISAHLPRPPVVTIMGHIDHGKTSLLDTIRRSSVTEEEAGGITQRIGAYKVNVRDKTLVFLDTPGHEAFTSMRARGTSVTDIVVLVVAADDGVMPQTLEAIHHANAANVPVLVAINKIDRPGSNLEKIKQELAANKVVAEEWGGETIFCEVSAKENIGIENLLEMILLNAEMLDLKANPDTMARGSIIESKLDKGRGPVATILIKQGTLKVGHAFVAGTFFGKVKALTDDRGEKVESGGPSMPLEVLGFSGVPNAGDDFMVVENDRKAHQIALKRKDSTRVVGLKAKEHVKLDNLYANISKGEVKDLNIIVKADVQGSIEAVSQAMNDIHFENVQINLIHGAVGGITETDINLAAASDAVVIGFNIRPTEKAKILYEDEGVDVRLYTVIYHAIDDIKKAVEGMLEPEFKEIITGRAEVRNTFNITKIGTIAGSFITSGKIKRNSDARLIRDSAVVHTGKVGSLRRFKDDVKEVGNGYECGIGLENYNDIKVSDVVETYIMEEVKRNL